MNICALFVLATNLAYVTPTCMVDKTTMVEPTVLSYLYDERALPAMPSPSQLELRVLASLSRSRFPPAWGKSPAGPKNGSAAEATSVTRDGQVNLGKSVVMNLRQESCAIIESS